MHCSAATDTSSWPSGEIVWLWTKKVLPRRGSSSHTTRGLLFRGGLQSFRRPADRQPPQCLRKVAAAHYPLQADCECETRQTLRLRPLFLGTPPQTPPPPLPRLYPKPPQTNRPHPPPR